MIGHRSSLVRTLANISLFVPALGALIVGYLALQRITYPTDVEHVELITPQPVMPGQVVDLAFTVYRYKTCALSISRVMERQSDKREFEMGFISQIIEADNPPFPRVSGYRIQIPPELTPGKYLLFSRFRYYCTGLDMWWPWVRKTIAIPVEVAS